MTVAAAPRRIGRPLTDPTSVRVPELQKLIERAGIKKSRIAWELGIDAALISAWSRGLRRVPSKYLEEFGKLLDTEFVIDGHADDGIAYSTVFGRAPKPQEDRSATAPPPAVAEPHRPGEAASPAASPAPAPARRRRGLDIGINGSPMGPGAAHTYCSCGKRVW